MNFDVFRDNLQSLIKSRGLSVRQFGIETGITSATLSRYMTEKRVPDLQYVMRIAAYFNVSIDWLVGFSDNKYSILPEEVREFATMYQVASEDDRTVVKAVLHKYKGKANGTLLQ
ncbi:MAG: helix-turn-helix domain-containing protein [Clostridia bacterium]|nr:helix-turn-helix domain-containing protein [Clostridia bacterium]